MLVSGNQPPIEITAGGRTVWGFSLEQSPQVEKIKFSFDPYNDAFMHV